MKFTKHTMTLLAALTLAASLNLTYARDAQWQASSGLTPQQMSPPWKLYDSLARPPVLQDGYLLINSTGSVSAFQTFEQSGTNVAIPTRFVMEARVRLVSGSTANTNRAPIGFGCITWPRVGNLLQIEAGEIFLYTGGLAKGPSAIVDTTSAPHTYRMEIYGLAEGSAVKIFYDGTNVLNGVTVAHANNGNVPLVEWGDYTSFEEGISEWYSVSHNALSPAPGERVLYGGIGNHLVTVNLTNGMAADLGAVSGMPANHYIRTLTPAPDRTFFATMEDASGLNPKLSKIDPVTRQATMIGSLTMPTNTIVWLEGLASNPVDRQLYGSVSLTGAGANSPTLVTLNPTNAVATRICAVTNSVGAEMDMDALGFREDGSLFALDTIYSGGGAWSTMMCEVDRVTGLGSGSFALAGVSMGAPSLERQGSYWFFSGYDERRLRRCEKVNLAATMTDLGPTHSTADFDGGRLLGMAFLSDDSHPDYRLTIRPGVQVGWPTLSNWTYQLQACPDVNTLAWTNHGPAVLGNGQTNWVSDPAVSGQKFFRVRVEH